MKKKIVYSNEPVKLGERVADFLPPPEQLVLREPTVKITIELTSHSVAVLRRHARRLNVPYQRMLRQLVDEYARAHPV